MAEFDHRELLADIEDRLGIGIVVGEVEPGPPVTITALLSFAANQVEVTVTGATEANAWRELAVAAARWRQSDEVSITRTYWGG
jgi:hypothetical protein